MELIQQGEKNLPEQIYGKQNTETWCSCFEKADLARQHEDWNEVVRLWGKSQAIGEQADNGFEIIPFIEGYGHLGDWEQVKTLTKSAKRITAGLEPSLCSTLDRLALDTPASQERDDTLMKLKEDLNCSNFQ